MSLDFIYTFQLQILESLKKLIGEHVNQIYISVAQDGNYPFILINLIKNHINIDGHFEHMLKNNNYHSANCCVEYVSQETIKKIALEITNEELQNINMAPNIVTALRIKIAEIVKEKINFELQYEKTKLSKRRKI